MQILKKFQDILPARLKRQSLILGVSFIISAFFEVIGIASILPFVQVLINPDIITQNPVLSAFYDYSRADSQNAFLFYLGLAVLLILLTSNLVLAWSQWFLYRFGGECDHAVGLELLTRYLRQPYRYFIDKNSSEMMKNILQEVNTLTYQTLIPLLTNIAKTIVTIFILALLFYSDPLLALIIGAFFTLLYGTIYLFYRKNITTTGHRRVESNTARYKIANEIFSGIKDVKILGAESQYLHDYALPSHIYTSSSAVNQMIRQIPRYFIEIIAFGSIMVIILYVMQSQKDIQTALPVISLYAFAGYRLMPGLQQIFSNMTQIRYSLPTLDKIHREFCETPAYEPYEQTDVARLPFHKSLHIDRLSFSFGRKAILKDISYTLKKGQKIGIIGATGAGKTTFVDIILGLLKPDSGHIAVDKTILNSDNIRQWQKNIGYVSQSIYLNDETAARNIAFGIPTDKIDMDMVRKAAKLACLDHFISEDLPQGYDTMVGERGIKLSGGQRQRIGIARALYHNPDILVFDEATSALDTETESKIIADLYAHTKNKTVIMIAHRLTTLQGCDEILLFDKGVLKAVGSYETLVKKDKAD